MLHLVVDTAVHGSGGHRHVLVDKCEAVFGPVRFNPVTISDLGDGVVSFLSCYGNKRRGTCALLSSSPWWDLADTNLNGVIVMMLLYKL